MTKGTNRERFLAKHGLPKDESLSLHEVASYSGMPVGALRKVYSKGLGAYATNPTSVRLKGSFKKGVDAPMSQKVSAPQWAMGRIFSFVMKSPKTFYGADRHIAEEYRLLS